MSYFGVNCRKQTALCCWRQKTDLEFFLMDLPVFKICKVKTLNWTQQATPELKLGLIFSQMDTLNKPGNISDIE